MIIEDQNIMQMIIENWEVVFTYGLWELKKIRQSMDDHNKRLLYLELKDQLEKELSAA